MLFSEPSFKEGLSQLRQVLEGDPRQIDDYGQRPFGVLLYDPKDEFSLSEALEQLKSDLVAQDRQVRLLSFAGLLREVLDISLKAQGAEMEELFQMEREFGQSELGTSLAQLLDADRMLASRIVDAAATLRPERDVLILTRAGLLYPFYRVNPLLEALGNFAAMRVATVLCYPGTRDGATGLRFMGEQDVLRGYRQRIF